MIRCCRLLPPPAIVRSRGCRRSCRCFQDEAFRWAQENTAEAKTVLSVPATTQSISKPLSTLEDYLEQRGWKIGDRKCSVALLSHVLSVPLTLWYSAEQNNIAPSLQHQWCCLGARAEATLPPEFWKELLMSSSQRLWNMDFVGPDLRPTAHPVQLRQGDSQLTIQWHHQGYFHDMPSEKDKPWDGIILLNPGLGHPHLRANWIPTLEKLRGQSMWLTAHSALDAERDAQLLRNEMGIDVNYELNPFASRISYQDPFDKTHFVSPNKYIAWIAKDG